ncbi:MAG TPA: hypothetical protein VKO63_08175, partial [Chitinispirillaceae bacterium]|nr:hypothetical protein [Chitinispirillaceae bacterium]
FEIMPIDKTPSPVRRFVADRTSANTLSDVKINCNGRFSDITYNPYNAGMLSLKLFNVNGRLLYSGNMPVNKGSVVSRFKTLLPDNNSIMCAEISFKSSTGSVYRNVQTVQRIR